MSTYTVKYFDEILLELISSQTRELFAAAFARMNYSELIAVELISSPWIKIVNANPVYFPR